MGIVADKKHNNNSEVEAGSRMTFYCQEVNEVIATNGPNMTATCMGNGSWIPDLHMLIQECHQNTMKHNESNQRHILNK